MTNQTTDKKCAYGWHKTDENGWCEYCRVGIGIGNHLSGPCPDAPQTTYKPDAGFEEWAADNDVRPYSIEWSLCADLWQARQPGNRPAEASGGSAAGRMSPHSLRRCT